MTTAIVPTKKNRPARFHRGDLTRAYPELPDYITPDEAHAIIDEAQRRRRDYLLFNLLWHSGMRISEALDFSLDHVRDNAIRIKGKGGRVRMVPVPGAVLSDLYSYALQSRIEYDRLLFNITRSQAHRLLQKYARAAGITRPVHCHLFRHGFAVNFLRQTGNIVYLQDLLGHSSIETTRIYVRAALPDVREAIAKVEF